MRTIVVLPGRYEPFHRGHKASYDHLVKQFGDNNVFIATSGVQAPITHPFAYSDKVDMITRLGISPSHVVKVKNPYQAQELTQQFDADDTALVFAVSEKDMGDTPRFKFGRKLDGSPSYMQPYPKDGKKLQPLSRHAYVLVTPTVDFKVRGQSVRSASEIRKMYADDNDAGREQIIADLYGSPDAHLKDIFDQRLLPAKKMYAMANPKDPVAPKALAENRSRISRLIESALAAERLADAAYTPFEEELAPDYICERTGQGY